MNVWIFVISALFTPVVEPLGLSIDEVASAPTAASPAAVAAPAVTAPTGAEPRFHGIERLFAKLEADAK